MTQKPIFILAPMDDVTDTVFRQVIADCTSPDLFFTEFVNVDGLQSRGRANLLHRLEYTTKEQPLVAQIWGKQPINYEKTAAELVDMGFAGVDINMGCPQKNVVKNSCCSALINNRDTAVEIIAAVKRGVKGRVPVSVKTRTGWDSVDLSWPELLLKQGIDMLTIHGRTRAEMSKVPARWEDIQAVRELRDKIGVPTKIIGNGDVMSRHHGEQLALEHGLDGIMIGRAIFTDPYVFAVDSQWQTTSQAEKLQLYAKHIKLFYQTYSPNQLGQKWGRNWESLKRMAKMYIHDSPNASALRQAVMHTTTSEDLLQVVKDSARY